MKNMAKNITKNKAQLNLQVEEGMNLMKEELTEEEVAEIIEARYAAESPKKLSDEDKKVVEERLKKIEEYGKTHYQK